MNMEILQEFERRQFMPDGKIVEHIRHLEHDLYYLMDFIGENGLWQEAKEHLEEHEDDPIPFGVWISS